MNSLKKLAFTSAALIVIGTGFSMAADDTDAFLNSLLGEETGATTTQTNSGTTQTSTQQTNSTASASTQSMTSTDESGSTNTQEESTQTSEDNHAVALSEPKVDLEKKSDGNYLNVKWDVDYDVYRPMVFVTKDGQQIFGDTADKANLKLSEPGTYNVSFQVKQNGEYVEAFSKTIENKSADKKAMSKVKVGPAEDMMIMTLIAMAATYVLIRARSYATNRK